MAEITTFMILCFAIGMTFSFCLANIDQDGSTQISQDSESDFDMEEYQYQSGACFHWSSFVETKSGPKLMKDVVIGEEVASSVNPDGSYSYSPVIAFLHKDIKMESTFLQLKTDSDSEILITPNHLIFREDHLQNFEAIYAADIQVGDFIQTIALNGMVSKSFITDKRTLKMEGICSPLTVDGTVFVNNILASCYADVDSHDAAHFAFKPLRLLHYIKSLFQTIEQTLFASYHVESISNHSFLIKYDNSKTLSDTDFQGIHWYAKMLCYLPDAKCT